MGDGCRQRPRGGRLVQMDDFEQTMARLKFRDCSAAALEEQRHNDQTLSRNKGEGSYDSRPIFLPERLLLERHYCARRKVGLCQTPALQLPRVGYKGLLHSHISDWLASESVDGQPGDGCSNGFESNCVAANNAMAKVGGIGTVDWRASRGRYHLKRIPRDEVSART